jgi:hypothetical protein
MIKPYKLEVLFDGLCSITLSQDTYIRRIKDAWLHGLHKLQDSDFSGHDLVLWTEVKNWIDYNSHDAVKERYKTTGNLSPTIPITNKRQVENLWTLFRNAIDEIKL